MLVIKIHIYIYVCAYFCREGKASLSMTQKYRNHKNCQCISWNKSFNLLEKNSTNNVKWTSKKKFCIILHRQQDCFLSFMNISKYVKKLKIWLKNYKRYEEIVHGKIKCF